MIDHMTLPVGDVAKAKAFFDAALKPLGYGVIMELSGEITGGAPAYGYGVVGMHEPQFWLGQYDQAPNMGQHVAFTARTRDDVDTFYAAAIAAGGLDNGGPGVRPHYHEHYYGAFVLGPDGHNVEAVCHTPG